jgi:hypothetical protein
MVHWSYKAGQRKTYYSYFGPVFSKLALMHTVYEGISNAGRNAFQLRGNGMLVQHFLSSPEFALFAYPYAATIYAESTTFLRNQ